MKASWVVLLILQRQDNDHLHFDCNSSSAADMASMLALLCRLISHSFPVCRTATSQIIKLKMFVNSESLIKYEPPIHQTRHKTPSQFWTDEKNTMWMDGLLMEKLSLGSHHIQKSNQATVSSHLHTDASALIWQLGSQSHRVTSHQNLSHQIILCLVFFPGDMITRQSEANG